MSHDYSGFAAQAGSKVREAPPPQNQSPPPPGIDLFLVYMFLEHNISTVFANSSRTEVLTAASHMGA